MFKYYIYRLKWWLAKYITPKYPIHIDIELTSRCNLKCYFCPQADLIKDFPIGDMEVEQAIKILEQMAGKAMSVKLNWRGEPFLYNDINKVIRKAKKLGYTDIMLNTNGQVETIKILSAIKAGVTTMIFSIDSLDDYIYKKIRGGGEARRVIDNAVIAKLWGCRTVKVNARICQYNNGEDWNFFKKYFRFYGIEVNIRPATERKRDVQLFRNTKRQDCLMPKRRVLIDIQGNVHPCCADWHNQLIMGNVKNRDIKAMWDSSIELIRQYLNNGKAFSHPPCDKCFSKESYK